MESRRSQVCWGAEDNDDDFDEDMIIMMMAMMMMTILRYETDNSLSEIRGRISTNDNKREQSSNKYKTIINYYKL